MMNEKIEKIKEHFKSLLEEMNVDSGLLEEWMVSEKTDRVLDRIILSYKEQDEDCWFVKRMYKLNSLGMIESDLNVLHNEGYEPVQYIPLSPNHSDYILMIIFKWNGVW